VPHTADARLEAWAPTRDECIAEAVLGLVESFADVSGVRPDRYVTVSVPEEAAEDMLWAVLDEVIFRLDVHGEVPVDVETDSADAVDDEEGGLTLRLAVTRPDTVEAVGAAPKGVSLQGLRCTVGPGGWMCTVMIDV
jgi:SHS2 domain-containing protein